LRGERTWCWSANSPRPIELCAASAEVLPGMIMRVRRADDDVGEAVPIEAAPASAPWQPNATP
jgi:hypothetical protein